MARRSKADRINEILLLNPTLRRDDLRIGELLAAEDLLKRAQKGASNAPLIVQSASGSDKRHPAWVAVDNCTNAVRRWRNELQLDRRSGKRLEAAGVKRKRSAEADRLLELYGTEYDAHRVLLPNTAALMAAHGILAEDVPKPHRNAFEGDLAEQAEHVQPIAERIRQYK